MAKEGGIPPAFLPWSIEQVHAALSDDGFLEVYYKHHASIDSPKRSLWMLQRTVPDADFHSSCRLVYVAKSAASLWYMHNTAGGKQPNQTVDLLEMAYCPSMARLTLTVTTDMLLRAGGPEMQAVHMWAKQWTFTATSSADGTSGCTVFGTASSQGSTLTAALRQVEGLVSLLKDRMTDLATHGKLISQLEGKGLMTGPPPSSPQGSTGSPGTPQNIPQPSRDFLRADVTPQEDIQPMNANPASVPTGTPPGKPDLRDARLSASDYEALRIGQRPQLPPHVKASEAARVLHVAKARMSPVREECPMPAAAIVPVQQTGQIPTETKGATKQTSSQAQPQEMARKSPISVIFEPAQGTSEPGSTKSIKAHTSPAPSPPRINISISSEGRRSISQAAPEALRSPGPLHFRASVEDGTGAGEAVYGPAGSISGEPRCCDAFPLQHTRMMVRPGTSTLLHELTYPPQSPQTGTSTDPAQALTTMMEVAVETVNTVAQIAMETVQKMSAVTIDQLNAAAQHGGHERVRPMSPVQGMAGPSPGMQRGQGCNSPKITMYHEPSATERGLGAKLWDVCASQKGSPRHAFSDCASKSFDRHNSITGSTAFHPSDLLPEEDAFLHGESLVQTPQKRRPNSAAPTHFRPAVVPLLWEGPSPFEYRGLETESFEETPCGSPSTASEQVQHAQQLSEGRSMPQIPSKAPPPLKRNIEKAAGCQQAQHAPGVTQAAAGGEATHPAEVAMTESDTGPGYSTVQKNSAQSADKAVANTAPVTPGTKPNKLRKFCHALVWGRTQQAGGKRTAGSRQ